MAKVRITLKRSVINRPKDQEATVIALGIKKLNHSVEVEHTPQIKGMITKVNHLVVVEEI